MRTVIENRKEVNEIYKPSSDLSEDWLKHYDDYPAPLPQNTIPTIRIVPSSEPCDFAKSLYDDFYNREEVNEIYKPSSDLSEDWLKHYDDYPAPLPQNTIPTIRIVPSFEPCGFAKSLYDDFYKQ